MNQDNVVLAISGGVDSAMSAFLLQEKGFRVQPVFFRLGLADQDRQQARAENIGRKLGLVTEVVDLENLFQKKVLNYFCRSYYQGITPNPCIICNPYIKFAALLQEADQRGSNLIATGHYARITTNQGVASLYNAMDPKKDQSYFLCGLSQKQLRRTIFPLGDWTKEEVRRQAEKMNLSDLIGGESQDVCFLKDNSINEFLRSHCPEAADKRQGGDIVDLSGKVLGRHIGIFCYTVGQRRGLGISDTTPYYVVAIDPAGNKVIVGKEEDLRQSGCRIVDPNWLKGYPPQLPATLTVKIRHRHPGARALVSESGKEVLVEFDCPQRAITPGQFAVFYKDDEVLGGGRIKVDNIKNG